MVGCNEKLPKSVVYTCRISMGTLFLIEGMCQSTRYAKLFDDFIGNQRAIDYSILCYNCLSEMVKWVHLVRLMVPRKQKIDISHPEKDGIICAP